jgi:hypothetical protein
LHGACFRTDLPATREHHEAAIITNVPDLLIGARRLNEQIKDSNEP